MTTGRGIDRGVIAAFALLALAGAFIVQQLTASDAGAAGGPIATKSAKLKLINDTSLTMSQPNESPRATVKCPGRLEPYGGAQSAFPPPDADGEGVYPHSYERLGSQGGFHSTPVLFEPTPRVRVPNPNIPSLGGTRSYTVKLQVKCGKKPGKIADPHDLALNVPSGRTVTLNAFCPKKAVLIGGGFQRAAFEAAGGVYPSESRAVSKREWQATGTAFGSISNDFVSIGYCMASPKRKPLIKEVSESVSILPRTTGFVTTPSCSGGRKMVWSGFDLDPKTGGPAQFAMLFADGIFNDDQSFTASAWNGTGGIGTLTAYGYCMKKRVIGGKLKKFTKKVGSLDSNRADKQDQDGNPNG